MRALLLLAALALPLSVHAHPGKAKHAKKAKVTLVGQAQGKAAAPVIVPLAGNAQAKGGAR